MRANPIDDRGSAAETSSTPGATAFGADVSAIALLNIALRYRRWALFTLAACLLGATLPVVVRTRMYVANVSMIAEGRAQSSMTGIAAQLGLGLGVTTEGSQSPQFYLELLRSREISRPVVTRRYEVRSGVDKLSGTLTELLDIRGTSPREREQRAIERFNRLISPQVTARTGVISIEVRMPYPELAKQVADQLVAELNNFNLQKRQGRAAAERRFVEGRLAQVKADLRQTEDRLQAFLVQNRTYANSPTLAFQFDRLSRDVAMLQAISTSLSQSYEQAKIDEVRDTPLLTVLEQPELPVLPQSRGALIAVLVGTGTGCALGFLVTFVIAFFSGSGSSRSESAELQSAWVEIGRAIRRGRIREALLG